uniref:Uncharacterized protein n=1 Tax=Cuerna arida TaxID=1464854 RepID=A0A1B6FVK8_9HEMI
MRKMLSITDNKNATNYVDSKKGRHSILDIIDLDEEEPVKTYCERKCSMEGDKIVEGKKIPIRPGFKERRLSQESEISKQVKLDVLKTGSIDLILTNFDTRGQRLSRDYGNENSIDYSAEKRPSTLYNVRKTHQCQLELTDSTDNNAKNASVRLDLEENRPRQFGPEERYPVGEDKEKNKTGPDITNGFVNGSRLMNPIKADSEKSRFVLKSNQQLITYDEPSNNDLLNESDRIPIQVDGEKKYLQIGDGVGMSLYKIADKRLSSLKEIKSTPMHPEPGERLLTRESETGNSGELYRRKRTPGKDEGRQPSLPPHDNGDGFKRHEDRGRDEKESEDASISSVEETEEYRVRLLISGHFHPGETPMFIIQEYEADSGVFDDQVVDIKRIQNIEDVNVNIAGKFYKENIIRERDDKSLFLNIKPHTIEIDHQTSKIYYDTFEDSFKIENLVDVVLKGRFVASTITREITPMLSFNIKKLDPGSVSSDNSMKNFTKKKPHLNITRFDQTIEMKGNPYKSQYLETSVVNIAREANVSFGKVANKVGTSSFDIDDELTISEPSHSNFGSLELTVDDWKPKQSGLYSYLPVIPLSLQKSLTSYNMEIIEVSGENKEIENTPQIKKRTRRRDAKQGEKPQKGANNTISEGTEYICRIKDYRPKKRKCFNFF